MALNPRTRDKLKTVSTATLATALFKRGFRHQFIQDVHPLNRSAGPMVGEAFTLRYMPAREDLNPITAFQDRAHPQRKAVEECPPGAVMVIDSRKDARAASAGSIRPSWLIGPPTPQAPGHDDATASHGSPRRCRASGRITLRPDGNSYKRLTS